MEKSRDIGYYFCFINREMEKAMNERLRKYDLTKSQQDILNFLHKSSKKMVIQKDIEEYFHISNPTVTGILNRLEQKGFIVRKTDERDRRIRTIVLTEKEEVYHQDIVDRIHEVEDSFDKIVGDRRDMFMDVLKELSESFEKEDK